MLSLTTGATPSGRAVGQERRRGVFLVEEIGEQISERGDDAVFGHAYDLRWASPRCKLRRLLCKPALQRIKVLEQACARQLQEVEAEGRILHIELLDLIVAHAQDHAAFDAFQRLGAHVRGRQHTELADNGTYRQFDAGFDQAEAAADDVEHVLGLLVLVEQHLAGLAFALGHERLQPLHRQVAADGFLHIAHQLQHLVQAIGIEHQHRRLHQDDQEVVGRDRGHDQHQIGEDAEQPQRDHRLHRARGDQEDRREKRARGACMLGQM